MDEIEFLSIEELAKEKLQPVIKNAFSNQVFSIVAEIIKYSYTPKALFFTLSDQQSSKSINISVCLSNKMLDKYKIFKNKAYKYVGFKVKVSGYITLNWYNEIQLMCNAFEIVKSITFLPRFCEKIAVISNENSKGFQDFKLRLEYGELTLFETALIPKNIAESIHKINETQEYQCICIVRGGGNNKEFDKYQQSVDLAKAIQTSVTPIILAIGHSVDKFSFDTHAYKVCSTPTDAAYFFNKRINDLITDINEKIMLLNNFRDQSELKLHLKSALNKINTK